MNKKLIVAVGVAALAIGAFAGPHGFHGGPGGFRFGPSEIERENSFTRQPNAIPYEQIEKILRTGTELQLCLKNKLYYILDPNRFENGTEADFWRLMNEKCSAAVPKKYRA